MPKLASFGHRLVAYLIDYLIGWLIAFWYVGELAKQTDLTGALNTLLSGLLVLIWYGLIYSFVQAFLTSKFGGSIGKLLTGLQVTDSKGEKIGFWTALFRDMGLKTVSCYFFGLGFFWMLKDTGKQTWHDMAAGTEVRLANPGLTLVGILILVSLIGLNGYLLSQLVNTVSTHLPRYEQLGTEFSTSFEDLLEEKPSPTPAPFPLEL